MLLTLTRTHDLKGDGYFLGRVGENKAEVLEIQIEPTELHSKWAYLEFKENVGKEWSTERLPIEDGKIRYEIKNGLLVEGKVKIEVVFRDENGVCWKSFGRVFVVSEAINAGANLPEENADFITEAQKLLDACENKANEMNEISEDLTARVESCESICEEINTSEAERVAAENERKTAESTREANEENRKTNETARVEAENIRAANEEVRSNNETARIEAELIRQENERLRVEAENSRQEALNSKATIEQLESELAIRDKLLENMQVANEGKTYENVIDETITYQKLNPSNVLPYATIQEVGGMSYKSKNLLNPQKAINVTEKSDSGFTINVYGTALYDEAWVMEHLKPNTTYYIKYKVTKLTNPSEEYTQSVWLTGFTLFNPTTSNNIFIATTNKVLSVGESLEVIANFTTPEDLTNYKLLGYCDMWKNSEEKTTFCTYEFTNLIMSEEDVPYEPYYEGFRHSPVSEIKSVGKNLFNVSKITDREDIIVNNQDGTLTVKDKSSSSCHADGKQSTLKDLAPSLIVGKTYTLSMNHTYSKGAKIYLNEVKHTWTNGTNLTITENILNSRVFWYSDNSADTIDDISTISNIQIEEGSVATDYEPYKEYILPIVSENLEGYGLGIDGKYRNYIDFGKKKYIQNVVIKTLNESVGWSKNQDSPSGQYVSFYTIKDISNVKMGGVPILSSNFDFKSWDNNTQTEGEFIWNAATSFGFRINKDRLADYDSLTTDSEKVKAFRNWINENPQTIIVPLATPIETDIEVNNLLKVMENGSITFENEHKQSVPSKIKYQVKLA